jgi:hypothetical protein
MKDGPNYEEFIIAILLNTAIILFLIRFLIRFLV